MNSADLKPLLIDLEDSDSSTGRKQDGSVQRERLSEGDIYYVYWVRKQDHSDLMTEGYVGITKDLNERLRSHKKNKKHSHFTSAIKKYGWKNLIVEILNKNLSIEKALEIENRYRPKENIGWNSQRGGYIGVNSEWYEVQENKDKHSRVTSEKTKEGIRKKDTSEARSERAKQNWVNHKNSYKDIVKGSKNPNAKLNEEIVKDIKYYLIPLGLSNKQIAKIYKVNPHMISFIRVGRTWSHV